MAAAVGTYGTSIQNVSRFSKFVDTARQIAFRCRSSIDAGASGAAVEFHLGYLSRNSIRCNQLPSGGTQDLFGKRWIHQPPVFFSFVSRSSRGNAVRVSDGSSGAGGGKTPQLYFECCCRLVRFLTR